MGRGKLFVSISVNSVSSVATVIVDPPCELPLQRCVFASFAPLRLTSRLRGKKHFVFVDRCSLQRLCPLWQTAIIIIMLDLIEQHRADINSLCRRYYVRKLSLFGSVLRSDFGPHSDIDILVEFDPEHIPGFFRLSEMADELSHLFGGRKVDLRTPQDLSRYFRADVLAHAEVQYAAS